MSEKIRVLIAGVCGKMGQETAKAVMGAEDMVIAAACDVNFTNCSLSDVIAGADKSLVINESLAVALDESKPDVMVDFTSPASVMQNVRTALERKVAPVVGTTGITEENLKEIRELGAKSGTPALIAPNFAIGAILMMKFAAEAAKYMPAVEIIELHHDKKLDAPSGTSIKTAEMIAEGTAEGPVLRQAQDADLGRAQDAGLGPARGEAHSGIRIHSVRLPGLVAHQEVILGGQGQTLTIRHDSIDRTSFMPGVLMAIRKVRDLDGVVYGLDNLL